MSNVSKNISKKSDEFNENEINKAVYYFSLSKTAGINTIIATIETLCLLLLYDEEQFIILRLLVVIASLIASWIIPKHYVNQITSESVQKSGQIPMSNMERIGLQFSNLAVLYNTAAWAISFWFKKEHYRDAGIISLIIIIVLIVTALNEKRKKFSKSH